MDVIFFPLNIIQENKETFLIITLQSDKSTGLLEVKEKEKTLERNGNPKSCQKKWEIIMMILMIVSTVSIQGKSWCLLTKVASTALKFIFQQLLLLFPVMMGVSLQTLYLK